MRVLTIACVLCLGMAQAAPPTADDLALPPPWAARSRPLSAYDRAYARIVAGETLLVYAGVKKPAAIAGDWVEGIPGKPRGIYRCYLDKSSDEPMMVRLSPRSEAPANHRPFSGENITTTIARTRSADSGSTGRERFIRSSKSAGTRAENTDIPVLTARQRGNTNSGCAAGG